MLTYKRKLKLTKEQYGRICSWIGACRLVYNMGLEIKIATYRVKEETIGKFALMKQLTGIKDIDWIKDVPAQTLQNSLERLDFSYSNFFRTCHSGGGFPKFAAKRKYKSITLKEISLIGNNIVKLPKIGELKFFKDSPIIGKPKTATIVKDPTGIFVCITCDEVNRTISNPDESQVIALDMGVVYFCTDSNGKPIINPKHFKKYEDKLAKEQQKLSGMVKFSNRWKKQAKKIALLHHKIANVRKDFLHKESTKLAKLYHTVFLEDLKIVNMTKRAKAKQDEEGKFLPNGQAAKSGLNKAILDCGWGMFRDMLAYKTNVVKVNPKHTSQQCSKCGYVNSGNRLSQSEFVCLSCGHKENADVNAAKNILSKGMALVNPVQLCVG
jgi:putative transposase